MGLWSGGQKESKDPMCFWSAFKEVDKLISKKYCIGADFADRQANPRYSTSPLIRLKLISFKLLFRSLDPNSNGLICKESDLIAGTLR